MPDRSFVSFQLPNVPYEQKLSVCLSIMEKQRKEVLPLRKQTRCLKLQIDSLKQQIQEWKEKYEKTKEELKKIRKENGTLKKEKKELEEEIEKLTKTKKRYQVALFDQGNFSKPGTAKKKKGGQMGHADTNRESQENAGLYQHQRLFVESCGTCGKKLSRVSVTRQKILIDIVLNIQAAKLLLESERQWCGNCKKEVYARDSRTLPFTEYGINTFMLVMILRFKSHASLANIATLIKISHGLNLSASDISNLLKQGKTYLKGRYDKLIAAIRSGTLIYADETGWLVNGEKAWMWIIASEEATVYYAAESRGKGIAQELYGKSQALCMHDGLASYMNTIPKDKQCYCWSHMLRFAHEETVTEKKRSKALFLKDELVRIYHIKKEHPEYSRETLKQVFESEIDCLLRMQSKNQSFLSIQGRLKAQREGLINSLLYTKDGTNNLAERELRSMVINKKISNGSNTFTGMETTAVVGSIVQTLAKKEANVIRGLTEYLNEGIKEIHKQYIHTPLHATS